MLVRHRIKQFLENIVRRLANRILKRNRYRERLPVSDNTITRNPALIRISIPGALISAGFEVSATVMGNNMGTLGTIATTCGTEADRSENATLIQKISADLLSNTTGTRSQFNTLRNALMSVPNYYYIISADGVNTVMILECLFVL